VHEVKSLKEFHPKFILKEQDIADTTTKMDTYTLTELNNRTDYCPSNVNCKNIEEIKNAVFDSKTFITWTVK
ncbi:hypothetical protein HK099_008152, partial [Clydaea vesicula]